MTSFTDINYKILKHMMYNYVYVKQDGIHDSEHRDLRHCNTSLVPTSQSPVLIYGIRICEKFNKSGSNAKNWFIKILFNIDR